MKALKIITAILLLAGLIATALGLGLTTVLN